MNESLASKLSDSPIGGDAGFGEFEDNDEVELLEPPITVEQLKLVGAIVEVKPIEKEQWHKKKGKESFTQAKTIECLYNVVTGAYDTGLTKEQEVEYSKKMGGIDLSSTFLPEIPHPYWSTKGAQVKLENHTMFFNATLPAEFVKIQNMKASKYVANSMQEYLDGKWPNATHVIFDETEQIEIKATKLSKRREADKWVDKMSPEDKVNILLLLSKKTVKNRSPNFIEVELAEVIDSDVENFLKTMKLGREEVAIRGKLTDAINRNILTREAGTIYYMGEPIAMDFEDAIRWFRDPQNSIIKVRILDKLSQK